MTAIDNILRDFGIRYVEGFTPPNFADLVAGCAILRVAKAARRTARRPTLLD